MFQVINAIKVAWHLCCIALFTMGILIDRELGQQLWMLKKKKPKQTPTRCQSQDRKQDYLETNKPLKLKKWNACKFEATSQ